MLADSLLIGRTTGTSGGVLAGSLLIAAGTKGSALLAGAVFDFDINLIAIAAMPIPINIPIIRDLSIMQV